VAKYFVSAVAMWANKDTGVKLAVSVEFEDGQAVTDIAKDNFKIGFILPGNVHWVQQTVSDVESSGSTHGFYTLTVANLTTTGNVYNWSDGNANSVLTVEVAKPAQPGQLSSGNRGQALAINVPITSTS
jgi:hypothetical protein